MADTIEAFKNVEMQAFRQYIECVRSTPAGAGEVTCRDLDGAVMIGCRAYEGSVLNRVFGQSAALSHPTAAVEAALDELDLFSPVGTGVELNAVDLSAAWRFRAAGYRPQDASSVKLVRPAGAAQPAPARLPVRELRPDEHPGFAELVMEVFAVPRFSAEGLVRFAALQDCRVFGALDGSRLVATGLLFRHADHGYLGFGATLAPYRGAGLQSAIMAARIEAATRMGLKFLSGDTWYPAPGVNNSSLNNFRRAGFRIASETVLHTRSG